MYYYDASFNEAPRDAKLLAKHKKQQQLAAKLTETDFFEVKHGTIVLDNDGKPKQSGVDTMIAIDMLSKAYKDQYDVAVLLAGDDDFSDAASAVKATGKQLFGAFVKKHISEELRTKFDRRLEIDEQYLRENDIIR